MNTKQLLNEWRSFLNEASRVIMDPGPERQHELTKLESIDKTQESLGMNNDQYVEFLMSEIAKSAGVNTYIRFVNEYDDDVPRFSVSPEEHHQTPHGIYGYPLNYENVVKLFATGTPCDSIFATSFSHFIIYKLNDDKKLKFKHDVSNSEYSALNVKYGNRKEFQKDFKECVRAFLLMLNDDNVDSNNNPDQNHSQIETMISSLTSREFMLNFLKSVYESNLIEVLRNDFQNVLANKLYQIILQENRQNLDPLNDTIALVNYKIIKKLIDLLSKAISNYKGVEVGKYKSLFLHLIGIDSVVDLGTSIIHANEPKQSHANDYTGNNITTVGTYDNIFPENNLRSNRVYTNYNVMYEKFVDVVKENPEFGFDVSKINHFYNDHITNAKEYRNFSLEDFKKKVRLMGSDMATNYRWSHAGDWLRVLNYSRHAKEIFEYAIELGERGLYGEPFYGLLDSLDVDIDDFDEVEEHRQKDFLKNELYTILGTN